MHVPINLYDGRILNSQHKPVKDGKKNSSPAVLGECLSDKLVPNLSLDQTLTFPGFTLKDVTPHKSYLGTSNVSSSYEEITYQEVRQEIIERRDTGRAPVTNIDIPITVLGSEGRNKTNIQDTEGGNKTNIQDTDERNKTKDWKDKLSTDLPCNTRRQDKVAVENETFKPFSRKLTYTVPSVEGKVKVKSSETSQQKVFPPKSPKKIQFRDDEKRSNYVISTQSIIKDQSKPTPPDVDEECGLEAPLERPTSALRRLNWRDEGEAESPIRTSGPTKVSFRFCPWQSRKVIKLSSLSRINFSRRVQYSTLSLITKYI